MPYNSKNVDQFNKGIDILCEAYLKEAPLFQYLHAGNYDKDNIRFFFDRYVLKRRQDFLFFGDTKGAIFWIVPEKSSSLFFSLELALAYLRKYGFMVFFRLLRLGFAFESLKRKIGGNCFELSCFGVLPEYQGQGIGSQLLAESFQKIDNEDSLPFFLFTQYPQNVKLYKKFGFDVKHEKKWKQNTGYYMLKKQS